MTAPVDFVRITFAYAGLIGRETLAVSPRIRNAPNEIICADVGVHFGQFVLITTMSHWDGECASLMDTFKILLLEMWSPEAAEEAPC